MRVLNSTLIGLGTALLSCLPLAAQQALPEMPLAARSRFAEAGDIWVSARAISQRDPQEWTFLRLSSRDRIEAEGTTKEYESGGCINFGPVQVTLPPGQELPTSLSDLARLSRGIFKGTVVDRDHGFYNGLPGTLLMVEVTRELKSSDDLWSLPFVYYFYPVGTFEAAGYRICAEDPRLPPVPSVGSKVLLLAQAVPMDEARSILADHFQAIFIETPDGALRVPSPWAKDTDPRDLKGLSELANLVERLAPRGAEVEP